MPVQCAVPMVAVRQVPISACGARKLLLKRLQMDIYVRHFGDVVVWSVPEPIEGPTGALQSGLALPSFRACPGISRTPGSKNAPAGGVRFRVNLGDNWVAVWHGVVF